MTSPRKDPPCPCAAPKEARERLRRALAESPPRLDLAALSIAALEDPCLDEAPVLAVLDALGAKVRGLLDAAPGATMSGKLGALREVMRAEDFEGERQRYFCPENSFLQRVLARKKGLPITLGVLYVEVGRRAGLPLFGINFPGHFLVGVTAEHPEGEELFVLDPFHGGRALDQEAVEALLQRMAPELKMCPALLAPASVEQIVWRMLSNLRRVYLREHEVSRALGVVDLMLFLAPDHPGELRTRASLNAQLGAFRAALRDVNRCLELTPDAPDAAGLRRARDELTVKAASVN